VALAGGDKVRGVRAKAGARRGAEYPPACAHVQQRRESTATDLSDTSSNFLRYRGVTVTRRMRRSPIRHR